MAAAGALLLIVLAIGLGAGLVLYMLVREEHEAREVIDRESGERMARRDTEE
ncbi:MAG: hypothetical protein V5A27_07985 [Halapricum sp.]